MESPTYKYWMYYVKADKRLYAYTPDKKFRKKFKKVRNMDTYFYEKEVNLTKYEVGQLAMDYQTYILAEKSLNSYDWEHTKEVTMNVVMTEWEYTTLVGEAHNIFIKELGSAWASIDIFNKKMQKVLKDLDYDKYHTMVGGGTKHKLNEEELEFTSIKPDYVQIFIKCFKETLNKSLV